MAVIDISGSLSARRSLSELDAVREISFEAARAADVTEFLAHVAERVLSIRGIYALKLENEDSVAWGEIPDGVAVGAAVTELVPGTTLRLTFDLVSEAVESPLKLVRFLAQQIQAVLTVSEFKTGNQQLRHQIKTLDGIVARRKTIHRARAILCSNNKVTEKDALILLRRYSRMQRCSLEEVAAAIVACEGHARRRSRSLPLKPLYRTPAAYAERLSA